MKKSYLLIALAFSSSSLFAQTLFTYGNRSVSKEEFLRAYNKNKTPVTDKEKSLREYLDLYTRFKLKVTAAEALRLDTLPQLKQDLQNFSSQVEEGYLNDEKRMNDLIEEAIQRSTKDIKVIHFSTPISSKTSTVDTVKAYQAMNEVLKALKNGNTDYAALAAKASGNTTAVSFKDLGYITTFSLPYGMENLVYGLDNGGVSTIYRTKSMIHIFKKVAERPSAGKWKVAQILFSIPPDASESKMASIKQMADSVYKQLQQGADFADMAKQYSEDRLTYLNGGELAEFGTGKFQEDFENRVFQLKKDGEYTAPFATSFGYHIVKRLQQRAIATDKNDEGLIYSLKQQISQDARINTAKDKFIKDVLVKIAYKRNYAVSDADLYRFADTVTVNKGVSKCIISNKVIFSFTNSKVTGNDWLSFVRDYKLNMDVYKGENNKELFDKYVATAAIEYYRKNLSQYSADFKYQLQEFKEGNMLFEIMERNVWGKAAGDSVGLVKYYNDHKSKYRWSESASILLFSCSDKATAIAAADALKAGKDWRVITDQSDAKVQADSGRYELAQLSIPAGTTIQEGSISEIQVNSGDNTAGFYKVLKLFPANEQRNFNEARGLVINEYQNYLEEEWLKSLLHQYPVKVNEAVFKQLLQ